MVGSRGDAAHCGKRFGLLTSMQFLGSMAGLLLASRAVEALGWRFTFYAAAAVVLATAFACIVLVRTPDQSVTPRPASDQRASSCPEWRSWRFWGWPRSSLSAVRQHLG
jgi:MFS family permease